MNDYMFLRWSQFNHYRHISDYISNSNLRFLVYFFSDDYKPYDQDIFFRSVSCYNANFVYNDFKHKVFYIGVSEWELSDGEMHCP